MFNSSPLKSCKNPIIPIGKLDRLPSNHHFFRGENVSFRGDGLMKSSLVGWMESTRRPNIYGCQPKNRGILPPKWMVKIMENPKPYEQMDDLGGFFPLFLETPISIRLRSDNPWACFRSFSPEEIHPIHPKIHPKSEDFSPENRRIG